MLVTIKSATYRVFVLPSRDVNIDPTVQACIPFIASFQIGTQSVVWSAFERDQTESSFWSLSHQPQPRSHAIPLPTLHERFHLTRELHPAPVTSAQHGPIKSRHACGCKQAGFECGCCVGSQRWRPLQSWSGSCQAVDCETTTR